LASASILTNLRSAPTAGAGTPPQRADDSLPRREHPQSTDVRVLAVQMVGQDGDLQQVRPNRLPAITTPRSMSIPSLAAAGSHSYRSDLPLAPVWRTLASQAEVLPAHGLDELDVADLCEVCVVGAGAEGDLLRGVRVVGRDVGVDRNLLTARTKGHRSECVACTFSLMIEGLLLVVAFWCTGC
jgi:hypothetical protein